MGNCLKIQLKASVANANLEKLGYLSVNFDVTSQGTYTLIVQYDDGTFPMLEAEDGLTIVSGNGTEYPVISGKGILRYPNKYNLNYFYPNPYYTVKWDSLKQTKTSCIGTYYGNVVGLNSVSQLNDLSELATITVYESFDGNHLSGNITDILTTLGSKLTTIDFRNITFSCKMQDLGLFSKIKNVKGLNGESVSGSIEQFVAARRSLGQSTSEAAVRFIYPDTKITFNGNNIESKNNMDLTWTADTITFDGVTITA